MELIVGGQIGSLFLLTSVDLYGSLCLIYCGMVEKFMIFDT